ncbi:transcriptional regulator [Leifsonia shinshuensis]|uniref:sugar-binding transcriptional regulator n=1 Tax=Leifsonia shinshuensis TaxID=150026 RepID=UPI001F511092|nr:sugar-binding domain-containing protein [Leifsonia shinshuensis]MCI0157367.1 transcriptional regulator [Leifsonia shinshuensis]
MSGKQLAPDEAVRLAYVGKRYFLDSRSRLQIAEELKISRFAVARLIRKALDTGIVSITISAPGPLDAELSIALRDRFELDDAYVITSATEDADHLRRALGSIAAELLGGRIVDGDILGVSSGRTLLEMSRALDAIALCDVVQLTGVADPMREHGTEAVSTLGRRAGGAVYRLPAPLIVTDEAAAATIARQPGITQSLAQLDRLTCAVVTIGAWPEDSLLHDSLVPTGEAADLIARGVVAEVGTTLLGADGSVVDVLDARMIGITADQLRAAPHVIGVGGGAAKHLAISSALRAGLLSALVTDEGTARYLLEA